VFGFRRPPPQAGEMTVPYRPLELPCATSGPVGGRAGRRAGRRARPGDACGRHVRPAGGGRGEGRWAGGCPTARSRVDVGRGRRAGSRQCRRRRLMSAAGARSLMSQPLGLGGVGGTLRASCVLSNKVIVSYPWSHLQDIYQLQWLGFTPIDRMTSVLCGIGRAAISWQVGVTGLHRLDQTPFQSLRACWHACQSGQSNVPM